MKPARIDTTQPGRCRDVECRAPVYWRKEASGKANPYDPPKPCEPCDGSGGTLDEWGEFRQCESCGGVGRVQVSHFATCPASRKFRRREEASDDRS